MVIKANPRNHPFEQIQPSHMPLHRLQREHRSENIRERVIAGLQTAKSRGVKLGRHSKMNEGMKNAVQLLRGNGMGIKQIAKELQIGVGTVYSAL